ncbi:hypothetical protein [Endozoicomonas sp. ALB032]|uniref:hypothetical protein n=1 Tax=Endozoicomonas sp. ALB032 TaxID=3403082 RepID=UPI003BB7B675
MNLDLSISAKSTESITREHCNSASKQELSGNFSHYTVRGVAEKLAKRFPISEITNLTPETTFWFTNEYPGGIRGSELSLVSTITGLRELCPISARRVSIVTGESGLLSCIPELSSISELIIQVDIDPVLLNFTGELLKNLSNLTSVNLKKYYEVVHLSLDFLKRKGIPIEIYESKVLKSAEMYKEAMGELHCFSSQRRFDEFKSALKKNAI